VSRQEATAPHDAPVPVVDPEARCLSPEVVLEVRVTSISGYEVCRALREEFGDVLGIVFVPSDRTGPSDRVAGLLVGADDHLPQPLSGDELLARIRILARRSGANDYLRARALRTGLTERELEVLQLLADGNDQYAIAEQLFITPKTVATHIEHILTRLPARSRAEVVAIAYRCGFHSPTLEKVSRPVSNRGD